MYTSRAAVLIVHTLTSYCTISVLSLPIETRAHIALAIQKYFYSPCVILPYVGERDMKYDVEAVTLQTLLSANGVPTATLPVSMTNESSQKVKCCRKQPLYIFVTSGPAVQRFLKQASVEVLSGARWLLFLGHSVSQFDDFFTDINIPFDCEFLVVHKEFGGHMVLAEVYRISPKLPLQTRRLGDLLYQNLYERRNNLHGLLFRSAVIESTNLLYITETQHNKILKIGGFFGEVWNALQMRLNFSSQFVKAPQNSWGVELPNHTWDGVMGSMVRGEANFSSIGLAATRARRRAIDFLAPLVELRTAVYIRKPGISTNWNNFLDPFSSLLWGTILLTIVILSACLSAAWRFVTRASNLPLWYIMSESVFRIFGNFCNQGHDMNMNSSACRMIIMTSYVTTTVLLAAYSAALVSFMTVQDFKLPFSSFRELLQLRHYRLGALAGSAQISYFEQSHDALMREMYRRKIQPEVDRLPRGVYEGLATLCTRHWYAYLASVPDAEMMKASLPCAVVHVPGTAIRSYLSFAISKRSPYKGILQHYSMRLASNGVIKRLYSQQYSARPFGNDASSQQIDIQAASPLLVVLGAGMLLSVLLCAGELSVSRLSVTAHAGRHSETDPSPKGRPIQKGYERRPLKKGKMRIKLKTEAPEGLKFCNQRQDEVMETSAFRTCHRCLQPRQRKLLQHTEMTSRTTLLYDREGEYTEQIKL